MALDDFDRIAAFQVAIWSIYLIGGIYLCTKHGFARSSGWFFLVVLSLMRIIGASFRLATISDPRNANLYIGWAVCSGIGLGMLIAVSIGLMSRLLTSVRRANGGHTIITPMMQRVMKLVAMVAIILFIVGGTQATWMTTSGGQPDVKYPTISKVGVSIMIALLVYSLIEAVYLTTLKRYIPDGEKRILLAVYLAFPFVAVRLAYSAVLVYAGYSPSPWFSLGVEVLMEVIAAGIFEVIGFTLMKETKDVAPEMHRISDPESQQQFGHGNGKQPRGLISRFL
jgi:hypothetical protein